MFFFEFLLSYMILVLKICSERVHVKYLNCIQRCSVSAQCSFYFTRVWNQSKIWIRIRIQSKTLNSYFTTAEWATLRRLLLYFEAVLIFLRNQIAIFMQLQKADPDPDSPLTWCDWLCCRRRWAGWSPPPWRTTGGSSPTHCDPSASGKEQQLLQIPGQILDIYIFRLREIATPSICTVNIHSHSLFF